MRIKFDSLNRYEAPDMVLCNPGSVFSSGMLSRVVGPVINTSDEEVVLNFNSVSALNFRATKVPSDGSQEMDCALRVYKGLQNRRLIFVDGFGYFIITDITEGHGNGISYKDVSASSCEIEIQNKALMYIEDGTYKFIDLFESIVSSIPRWMIGHIDSSVLEKYRTFEDVDVSTDTLSFLVDSMQEAYECIFIFDTTNRIINVYDQNDYVLRTDIHLTNDDVISSMDISENVDNLYTALSVFGDGDLTVSAINPLGSTTVYDFSYYLDWMSDGLRDKVSEWTKLLESYLDPYYNLNVQYYDLLSQRTNCESEIARLTAQLEMYSQCRENVVAESSSDRVTDYNEIIENNGGEQISVSDSIDEILAHIDTLIEQTEADINTQGSILATINGNIDTTMSELSDIHNSVSFQTFFTQQEYDELYDYIYECTFSDEYITVTDNMTMVEKLNQMRELYSRATRQLRRVASPVREFSVDTEEFIFSNAFQNWSTQLEVGCLINIEIEEGNVAELFLQSMELNWHDNTLSFTFGSQFNKSDPQSLFKDVLGNVDKSANSINYIKDIIYPVKNGKIEELETAIQSVSTLALDASIASQSGEIRIDASGYTGKKQVSTAASSKSYAYGGRTSVPYEREQLKIAGNTIVFTEDAWATCVTALGYVSQKDMSVEYGVNARAIIGDLILSDRFNLYDSSGKPILVVIDDKIESRISPLEDDFEKAVEYLSIRIDNLLVTINDLKATVGKSANDIMTLYAITNSLSTKMEELQGNQACWYEFSELT